MQHTDNVIEFEVIYIEIDDGRGNCFVYNFGRVPEVPKSGVRLIVWCTSTLLFKKNLYLNTPLGSVEPPSSRLQRIFGPLRTFGQLRILSLYSTLVQQRWIVTLRTFFVLLNFGLLRSSGPLRSIGPLRTFVLLVHCAHLVHCVQLVHCAHLALCTLLVFYAFWFTLDT